MTDAITLRDYQQETINQLRQALGRGSKRPVVQAPTGAGKTVIAAALVNMAREKGKKVLFCVPALSLIDQTVERFRANGIFDLGVIQGIHDLTDYSQPVQVCSVQTLARRNIPQADLVIIDEAHVMFRLYEKWFKEDRWKNVPFVGLTATPWSKGMGSQGMWDDLIVATTTQKLIEEGSLSDFKVYAPSHPDLSAVKTVRGDYDTVGLGTAMNKGTLIADIVSTWLERAEWRPTVCFAVNRVHAKNIQKRFEEHGVPAAYMDAFTNLADRAAILEKFASGQVKIICNVGVLTTGFDADVRCVILARPTKSEILYVQMIGRGLRTAPGKDHCLILDHSDTTLRLGFVTDIHHERLDDGTAKREAKQVKELLPKECPQCHFVKPLKARNCPSCGFQPQPKSKIECEEGELQELTRDKKSKANQYTKNDLQHWYSNLILHANLRGYKPGWAYWAFKDKFKVTPPSFLLKIPAPDLSPDVQSWIKSRNIRRAKSQFRGKAA
jgi:superfamily II DNA or RNA helicase